MQLNSLRLAAHDQRARVLRHPGAVDRVDDLERVLDDDALGHVQEGAAGPERRVRGLQLVTVDRQALGVPALGQLAVIAKGFLQRAEDHAALGQRGSSSTWTTDAVALHDPPGVRAVGQRARDDLGHRRARRDRVPGARGLQRVEVEALQARRPEPRAPPHRQLRGLIRLQRGLAQLLQRAPVARAGAGQRVVERRLAVATGLDLHRRRVVRGRRAVRAHLRHWRRPPGGSGRSPRARAVRPARRRPPARSARPSGCARTAGLT